MDYPDLTDPIPGIPEDELDQLAQLVREYCGWHIAPVVQEEVTVRGTGGSTLLLPSLNVVELVSLTVDGVAQTVATVNWDTNGVIEGVCSPRKARAVKAVIRHGYDECPATLRAAMKSLYMTGQYAGLAAAATLSNSFSVARDAETGEDPYTATALGRYKLPPRP